MKHAPSDRDPRVSLCGLIWWIGPEDERRATHEEDVACRQCSRLPDKMRRALATPAT